MFKFMKSLFTRPATPPQKREKQYRVVRYVNGNGNDVWFIQEDWFGTWQFVHEDTFVGRKRMPYYTLESAQSRMAFLANRDRQNDVTFVAVEVTP